VRRAAPAAARRASPAEALSAFPFGSAASLVRALRARKVSSVELLKAYLERVDRLNPAINAIVVDDRAKAMAQARAADRALARGAPLGPLHGLPMTVKEAFDLEGHPTTHGHPPMRDNLATQDALAVQRLKAAGVAWWANISTVAEARAAEAAGADVVVAQGMEAGGHRGCFDARLAEAQQVGLFSLLPAVADAVRIPVVATGGIADARGVAAAFALGASAVQVGTGFLRAPEAGLPAAWADALANTPPEGTVLTRAFSGRAGRSIATAYVQAAAAPGAPLPAPYPVQRGLTAAMRQQAVADGDVQRMQAWAGQSAALAQARPAALTVAALAAGVPRV